AEALRRGVEASEGHLAAGDAAWFAGGLAAAEHWRLFADFRHAVAYVDIETTGLGGPDDYITAVAVYDGTSVHSYVQGENLFDFRDAIDRYRLLVTYNGKSFDLPWLRRTFGTPLRQAHIDLRYTLARLGYRGGLKGCERQLGLDRGDLAEVDGRVAVWLWWDWHSRGNRRALDTLLAYNTLDVVHLERLLVFAYNTCLAATPFADRRSLAEPEPPSLPFQPDPQTLRRVAAEHGHDLAGLREGEAPAEPTTDRQPTRPRLRVGEGGGEGEEGRRFQVPGSGFWIGGGPDC
ncbi:MAG: ribonuclease H-like domain-containing protein, partial [bacterium]